MSLPIVAPTGLTLPLAVSSGGTAAGTALGARANLGLVIGTDVLAPTGSGAGLTALNATQLTSGTVPDARFPATLPALSGVNLTALNASALASGTTAVARGGTGQATVQAAINAFMAASGALSQGDIWYFNGMNVVRLAAGANGTFLRAYGAAQNVAWAVPTKDAGYIYGLTLSNNGTDATNDIDIAVGSCRDYIDGSDMYLGSALTKRLDADWSVGTGNGMRNSAAAITDTTYHLWLVSDGAVVDVYAHTSATAATVLTALQAETGGSGYLYLRRIGSIVRVSGVIKPFIQDGDRFWWVTLVHDFNSDITTARTTITLTVPIGIRVQAVFRGSQVPADTGGTLFTQLDETDSTPSASATDAVGSDMWGTSGNRAFMELMTNTSGQIGARASAAATSISVHTRGYRDTRGRDN